MAKVTIKGKVKNVAKALGSGKTYYLHTLDGWPASFFRGEGILFCSRITLATSLRQIRREQNESRRIRPNEPERYGYKLCVTP
jgi:hypothetical protein